MQAQFQLYKHIDGTIWAHIDMFGPWYVFVDASNLNGPRIHVTAEFSRNYSKLETH